MDSLTDENGKFVKEDIDMCDVLNKFFSSVFSREEQEGILPEVEKFFQEDTDSALTNIEISEEAIKSKLKMLKPGKAPVMDGLVPKFFN